MIDHNMTRLRKKIINLFKLSPEADFVRIYIDVDGDIVALDDDDELHETAINQPLNPLRISVLLRSNASDGHDLKHENMSSATAVPPQVDKQPFEFSSVINEAFRSVPEQFCTALSNISHDFLSKAASSAPAIADVLDHFSKLEIPSCSQTVNSSTGESSGTPSQLTSQPKNHNISREPKVPSTSAPVSTILIQFQRTCMSMSVVMEIRLV